MEIVQEIGAYAGLAAVVGLGVLSALYFSQARDVRRLREWAGRAPERSGPPAHTRTQPPGATAPPRPGAPARPGQPVRPGQAPARATQAGAGPAAAVGGAAAAGGAAAGGAAAGGAAAGAGAGPASPAARSAAGGADAPPADSDLAPESGDDEETGTGDEEAVAVGEGGEDTEAPSVDGDGEASPGEADRPSPPVPRVASGRPPLPRPPPRLPARPAPPRPTGGHTEVIPPPSQRAPWYRRDPRLVVLAVAGVLIVGGAAAFGITQLGGSAGGEQRAVQPSGNGSAAGSTPLASRRGAVNPASVTVSVLNGTTVPGLAAQIGDEVEAKGFQLGNVTNASGQGVRNESVVFFAAGGEREAIAVGRALDISQREGIDPRTQSLAGDARVAVVAGSDKTR